MARTALRRSRQRHRPKMPTYGGRVVFAQPGVRCLSCAGMFDQSELSRSSLQSDQLAAYDKIYGIRPSALEAGPTVVSINAVIASLAATEVMAWVTGLRTLCAPGLVRHAGTVNKRTDSIAAGCAYCRPGPTEAVSGGAALGVWLEARPAVMTLHRIFDRRRRGDGRVRSDSQRRGRPTDARRAHRRLGADLSDAVWVRVASCSDCGSATVDRRPLETCGSPIDCATRPAMSSAARATVRLRCLPAITQRSCRTPRSPRGVSHSGHWPIAR